MNNEVEGIWAKKANSSFCLEGRIKTTRNRYDSRLAGLDSKRAASRFESEPSLLVPSF